MPKEAEAYAGSKSSCVGGDAAGGFRNLLIHQLVYDLRRDIFDVEIFLLCVFLVVRGGDEVLNDLWMNTDVCVVGMLCCGFLHAFLLIFDILFGLNTQ